MIASHRERRDASSLAVLKSESAGAPGSVSIKKIYSLRSAFAAKKEARMIQEWETSGLRRAHMRHLTGALPAQAACRTPA